MSEAERALIGMAIRDRDVLELVHAQGITVGHLSDPDCISVLSAITEAESAGKPTDMVTLTVMRPTLGQTLATLRRNAPLTQDPGYFATEVLAAAWRRRIIEGLSETFSRIKALKPHDSLDPARLAIARFFDLAMRGETTNGSRAIADFIPEVESEIEKRVLAAKGGRLLGIPTGFKNLDALLYGWNPGKLYTLAARPSVGKTTVATNFALTAAKADVPTALFTVEMAAVEIGNKLISRVGEINFGRYMTGRLSESDLDKVHGATKSLAGLPLIVNEENLSFERLCLEVRRLHKIGRAHV